MSTVKQEATKLIKNLPENVTWEDIMYEFYVREKIEMGLKAVENKEIISHEEMIKRFSVT